MSSDLDISGLRKNVLVMRQEGDKVKLKSNAVVYGTTTRFADFVYNENGTERVIDTKGFRTKEYQLKKKMMRSLLGIEIIEK